MLGSVIRPDGPDVIRSNSRHPKENVVANAYEIAKMGVQEIVLTGVNIGDFGNGTEVIEGIILAPGEKLGELFSYVSAESYKCQRAIPMSFFESHYGKSVFNPD